MKALCFSVLGFISLVLYAQNTSPATGVVPVISAYAIAAQTANQMTSALAPPPDGMCYVVLRAFDGQLVSSLMLFSSDTAIFVMSAPVTAYQSPVQPHYTDSGQTMMVDGYTVKIFELDNWPQSTPVATATPVQ